MYAKKLQKNVPDLGLCCWQCYADSLPWRRPKRNCYSHSLAICLHMELLPRQKPVWDLALNLIDEPYIRKSSQQRDEYI